MHGVDGVLEVAFPVERGISKVLTNVDVTCESLPSRAKAVWIQPKSASCDDIHFISFEEFAAIVDEDQGKDALIRRSFAGFLRKWAKEDAGAALPQHYDCL